MAECHRRARRIDLARCLPASRGSQCQLNLALVKLPADAENGGSHPRHMAALMDVIARAQRIADEMNAKFDAEWIWEREDSVAGLPGGCS